MLREYLNVQLSSLWLSYYAWPLITDGSHVCRSLWIHQRIWDALSHFYTHASLITRNNTDLDLCAETYLRSDINTTFLAFFNGLFTTLEAPSTVYVPPISEFLSIASKFVSKEPIRETFAEPHLEDVQKNVFMYLPTSRGAETYEWLQNTINTFWEVA
jgi:hypothetical protein